MERINRQDLSEIAALTILFNNWETWGQEYNAFIDSEGKSGQNFSWRNGIYYNLRNELSTLTNGHCSFCDVYPFDSSKKTIEHFKPKSDYPLIAYQWENLFYCCDKCQSNANKIAYQSNIKPDHTAYEFNRFFYFDEFTFKIEVIENLASSILIKGQMFLERYGINNEERIRRRENVYRNLKNYFQSEFETENARVRNDFSYRYIYDLLYQQYKRKRN